MDLDSPLVPPPGEPIDLAQAERWRSVLVLIDKRSGELVTQDDSGLLG